MQKCFGCAFLKEIDADVYVCNHFEKYLSREQVQLENSCLHRRDKNQNVEFTNEQRFTFEIIEEYGEFDDAGEWSGQVNKVSWNGRPPKLDIRYWKKDGTKSRKIGTLSLEAAKKMAEIIIGIKSE